MPDQTITCVDCQSPFQFSESEQQFFAQKGFSTPKRCKPCREIRKQSKVRQDQQRG